MEPIEENPWPRPDNDVQKPNASAAGSSGQDVNNPVPNTVIEKHVQKRIFKIIVIGDSNVGKTCLTFRFCGGSFPEKTEATIGVDFREKTLEVEGEIIKLQLWDTAGQERFRKSMVQHYYRNVHAVVFVYDVTKISSFENLPVWIEECDRHNLGRDIPRILVGNKCDMKDKIAVNTNMAQKFADAHNMPVFETSAKDDAETDHVEAIFMTLAHKLKTAKPLMPPQSYGGAVCYKTDTARVVSINKAPSSHSKKEEKDSCSC